MRCDVFYILLNYWKCQKYMFEFLFGKFVEIGDNAAELGNLQTSRIDPVKGYRCSFA